MANLIVPGKVYRHRNGKEADLEIVEVQRRTAEAVTFTVIWINRHHPVLRYSDTVTIKIKDFPNWDLLEDG